MKAAVYYDYGSPDVIKCEEIEKPVPKDDEVLIKVRAASLNPLDWRMMKGVPSIFRILFRLRKPTITQPGRLGRDVAGQVEALGRNVTQFKPGDEVFGACEATVSEYACARESRLVIKPVNVTFEQAASVPVAGLTALQCLRDKGQIQTGQKVLINGAAGGVGTFAVQIAKSFGADAVIDYTQEDFTKLGGAYDLILDCVGNYTFSTCRRVLNPKARYVIVGAPHDGSMIGIMAPAIKSIVLSWFVSQKAVMFVAKSSQKDLTLLGELMATGKVTPVIDRRYALSDVADAIRYLEEGHARGKVVITLGT